MTSGIASALKRIDPNNELAGQFLKSRRLKKHKKKYPAPQPGSNDVHTTQGDWASMEKRLEEGYTSLKLEAKLLREELQAIHSSSRLPVPDEEMLPNLLAISSGRISAVIPMVQPLAVRETARAIMTTPNRCQELIIEDFEAVVRWAGYQNPPLNPDAIRERLVKRKTLLEAALPEAMGQSSVAALRHIEREYLDKKYVNSETMLGDKVEDIPKQNFFVSEDNFAWDMDELAQAITANDGVMRNPLSKQLFSELDIRMILRHPLGQRLKPMQLQQAQLKKGIRPATIDRVGKLGRIMLADQTVDTAPSRQAMDEFQAYVATLPDSEQRTIKLLKIPAIDSTSGQPFDYTIGESVRDAIANTTCFHKVCASLCGFSYE